VDRKCPHRLIRTRFYKFHSPTPTLSSQTLLLFWNHRRWYHMANKLKTCCDQANRQNFHGYSIATPTIGYLSNSCMVFLFLQAIHALEKPWNKCTISAAGDYTLKGDNIQHDTHLFILLWLIVSGYGLFERNYWNSTFLLQPINKDHWRWIRPADSPSVCSLRDRRLRTRWRSTGHREVPTWYMHHTDVSSNYVCWSQSLSAHTTLPSPSNKPTNQSITGYW